MKLLTQLTRNQLILLVAGAFIVVAVVAIPVPEPLKTIVLLLNGAFWAFVISHWCE